ncbi:hypothetical protein [Stackebrandtia nassauensis]|uniref:ESX secretion-associated protein EspG n=1 Tax=Stackebrandtia nassauensis (strain DSM 44728 / CIP 108903 / NRRL B-16338 / NBRC 102104 / LLR-40K-21) TaxID=446470 RepID=D3Q9Y2_STANL|nr:hypothetical protein [Stackebrandtia nassauensis]ADD40694.1 hypothetical protein Snas_0984 [Stackebrandtia nassauensis DSM 44728]
MTVAFDAASGRLRIDQLRFDRFLAWANGDTSPGPDLDELRQAGAIFQDDIHPVLAPSMRVVAEYLCQLRIDLIDDHGDEKSGDGWISPEGAVLLLDLPDGMRQLHAMPAEMLPAAIARVTRLGPRPVPGAESLHLTRDVFEGLLAAKPEDRQLAADRLALDTAEAALTELVARLVAGPWRRWTVSVAWYTPQGEPASRNLQVLDTDRGMCLCEVSGVNAALLPTNATGVWRRLTALLPDDVEGA